MIKLDLDVVVVVVDVVVAVDVVVVVAAVGAVIVPRAMKAKRFLRYCLIRMAVTMKLQMMTLHLKLKATIMVKGLDVGATSAQLLLEGGCPSRW